MNEGQTHGIPIGPDTSLVIAELILSAVDSELLAQHGARFSGFRYVDDYELACASLSHAEEILTSLQNILASFELQLNPEKTRIVDLPQHLEAAWSAELRSIAVRDRGHITGQRNDIVTLFSRAFEFATQHRSDSVLRYAVSRVQRLDVAPSAWRTFHNCVLGAAGADASTLSVVLGTLHEVSRLGGHAIPKAPLSEVLESIIRHHAARSHGSEVAWAIFGALAFDVELTSESAQAIAPMEDDVVAILSLHAKAKGLFPNGSLDLGTWSAATSGADALRSEHWLLAYEAGRRGWLNTPALAKDPFFGPMAKVGVGFYEEARVIPQFPQAARAQPGGALWPDYA